jgi:hypothetical protein
MNNSVLIPKKLSYQAEVIGKARWSIKDLTRHDFKKPKK